MLCVASSLAKVARARTNSLFARSARCKPPCCTTTGGRAGGEPRDSGLNSSAGMAPSATQRVRLRPATDDPVSSFVVRSKRDRWAAAAAAQRLGMTTIPCKLAPATYALRRAEQRDAERFNGMIDDTVETF